MKTSTSILSNKVLIFDIESEYGHFRKFNTTSSPLTYSIPTRQSIVGLIGAILGIEREISANNFKKGSVPLAELFAKNKASIGIQILEPTKKVNIGFNLLDTGKIANTFFNVKQRTQIEFELLKNPKFRIYISLKDPVLFDELINKIKLNQTFFTPYLGLSQFTASIKFVTVSNIKSLKSDEFQEVLTAVNLTNVDNENPIKFDYSTENSFKYTTDTFPVQMDYNRIVSEYSEIIIETNGKPIKVKSKEIYHIENVGNIIFL